MTVYLSALAGAGAQFFDNNGVILSGGKLYSYAAGTTTPQTTYTSAAGSTAHTNPIILNSAGRVATGEIWLTSPQTYKFALYTSTDVLIATWDNIDSIAPASSIFADFANTSNVAKGDALVGFKQSNAAGVLTGAVAGTVHTKLQEFISAKDFGAVGDGVTNETSVFATLESGTTGKAIDLLNGIYLVNSVPVGNNYYNGAFKVGTDIFWQNRNPRAHPFEGPATSVRHINPRVDNYTGLSSAMFPCTTGGAILVWREANTHAVENGTRIKAAWTDDGGRTLKKYNGDEDFNIPTISYNPAADTRNIASGIINGRFVIIATRREEPQSLSIYMDPISLYSDDEGVTWNTAAITGLANKAINFHSKVYPWPSGGVNGAIVYDYRTGGIGALTSVDGGVNWSDIGIIIPVNGAFPSLSEMSVARIGDQNKWVMVIRGGSTSNFAVATSANMTTWTAAANSGVLLKGNPPELMYADGKIWLVSFSRRNQSLFNGYENAIVVAEGDPELVFSSGGVSGWSGWKIISQLGFWPSGYLSVHTMRGRYYALMTGSEETAGSSVGRTAFLAMLSTDLVDVADTRTILEAVPQHNLISNGMLEYWPNGTSFTTAATRTLILPDFTFARGAFTSGFTVSQIAGDTQKYAMRIRRDDGDTSTTTMGLTHTLTQLDSSKFIIGNEYLGIQFRCRKGSGFSATDGFLTVQVRYTDTAGEQQVTTASGTFTTTDEPVQSASTGMTPTENWENYFLPIGPVPDAATQLLIRWTWAPVGTASNDYIDLEQVTLFVGKQRSPVVKRTYAEVVNDTLPFFWTGTVRSENGSRWISFPTVMHRTPTVTVSAGTASNISTLGFELSHGSAADITVTAQAWL
jgi:hypothetical protein